MRAYKPTYKDRHGKYKKTSKWWIELKDHLGNLQRFPAFTDKKQSELLGDKIEKLVVCRQNTEPPDRMLSEWLGGIPDKLRKKLLDCGLIDKQKAAAGKSLSEHLSDFEEFLKTQNTESYAIVTCSRVKKVFEICGAFYLNDVSASTIQQCISGLRKSVEIATKENGRKVKKPKDLGPVSSKTKNYYLRDIKHFFRWLVQDGRIAVSPVEYLGQWNAPKKEHRRALSFNEACKLLTTTEKAPRRFSMTGHQRAVLYLLAMETGLRVSELISLTVSSFDFGEAAVTVKAEHTKNGQQAVQLIKRKRIEQLKGFFANKMPTVKAFDMPTNYRTAKMLKADLADAGIAYVDDAGRKADFHCLRHTLATELDRSGASLKERMAITRHSDKSNLTLGTYTHVQIFDLRRAIENLPDYPWPGTQKTENVSVA